MPDTDPAAPALDAAAQPPATPSPAAPDAPAATPPDSKKLSAELFRLLSREGDDPTEPPKQPDKPATPAAPAALAKDDKPIRVKKSTPAAEVPPAIPTRTPPAAPAAPAPAAAPVAPAKSDADFENELVDEEKALLEDARAAEKYLPDKYKGQSSKMTAFFKEVAKRAEDPEFDENDPAFQKWYAANLPKISVLDHRALERARVKEDVTKEFEPKLEQERHARWVESETPKLKAKGDAVWNKLIQSALPDEMAQAITERTKGLTGDDYRKAVATVEADYRLENEVTRQIVDAATADIEEFNRLTTRHPSTGRLLSEFDPKNAQHDRLLNMVSAICDDFKSTGGAELKKGGKWFATRAEWTSMQDMINKGEIPADSLKGWWTFTNEDIIDRAVKNVKPVVTATVAERRKQLEEYYGFKRTIASPAAAAARPPVPGTGAPPAPRPGMPPANNGAASPTLGQSLAAKLAG